MAVITFAAALDAAQQTDRYVCAVTKARDALKTDRDRVDFDAALKHPKITSSSIRRALEALGVDVASQGMIQRHRRNACACARGNR